MSKPATPKPFVSYSANREDVYLNRVFAAQPTGFYVDVGAAHPMYENDTRALYERGWSGINIEPNEEFFGLLAEARPRDRNLRLAVSDEPGELAFHQVIGTGLSTADAGEAERARERGHEVAERRVAADTLRHILDEAAPNAIDLLKIDVEGFELKVLQSNDWTRFRPHLVLVEATFPDTPVRRPDLVTPYLETQGYRRVFFDGLNDYFIEQGFEAPPDAFDRPVNIFDHFQPLAEVELVNARDFLGSKVAALEEERGHAQAASRSMQAATDASIAALQEERANAEAYALSLRTALDAGTRDKRRLQHLVEAQSTDLSRASAELVAMRERSSALALELDAALDRVAAVLGLADRSRAETAEAQTRCTEAQARLAAEQAAALSTAHAQRQEVGLMLRSTSWRVTRPLRALRRPRRSLRILLGRSPE